jgi:hypothetical protein
MMNDRKIFAGLSNVRTVLSLPSSQADKLFVILRISPAIYICETVSEYLYRTIQVQVYDSPFARHSVE